jgi:hypothetical protein
MTEFEGLGAREDLELTLSEGDPREYVLHQKRYGLTFRTFQSGEIDAAELMGKQITQLNILRRKFLEDLRRGDRIFVYKRNDELREQDVLPLHAALGRFATNTLLFVTPTDPAHPPGTVERLMPGLFRGSIDRFAPLNNPNDLSLERWLNVCVNSFLLALSEAATTGTTSLLRIIQNR